MKLTLALLVLALPALASAQEEGTVINPVPQDITITKFKIISFQQWRVPDWRFIVVAQDNNGKDYTDEHVGVYDAVTNPRGADKFLKQLNTMNFSTNSMVKRLLQHLADEKVIPPITVTGTPDPPVATEAPKLAPKIAPPLTVPKKGGRGGQ